MALHQMNAYRSEVLGRGLPRSPVEQERVSGWGSEASPGTARGRVLKTHRAPSTLSGLGLATGVLRGAGTVIPARRLLGTCSMPDPALGMLGAGQAGERALRVAGAAAGPALPPATRSPSAGQETRRQGPPRAEGQDVPERAGRTRASAGCGERDGGAEGFSPGTTCRRRLSAALWGSPSP